MPLDTQKPPCGTCLARPAPELGVGSRFERFEQRYTGGSLAVLFLEQATMILDLSTDRMGETHRGGSRKEAVMGSDFLRPIRLFLRIL